MSTFKTSTVLLFSFLLAFASVKSSAAEPTVVPEDLPRIPPTAPEKALETFRIKDGFRIELVASEPLVVDPIAICFDENSRMFVVEMRDYSERRDERLGRIRMLEDTDGDGRMDRSTIFAEDLPWPTALFWYDGGLFVASTPDLFYFRDQDGDGKSDQKKVVFTGFGAHASRLNVQALPNNFHWTIDNRIHGATSFNGGVLECPIHPDRPKLSLRGQDFSFDPKNLDLRAESGGGQHGLTFDNFGRKFICSNSSHIRQVMYEARYLSSEISYPLPPAALDIPADGAAAEVYRISPDEPWRVIRTKWRVAGLVSGPIEGGGRASGYFTSASGLVIYRGNALREEFLGDEFVADVGSNLIHRKKLRPDGVAFIAERPADEQKVEFLASSDNWFRPVQLANGPDGALYILDMYRETIEHPWSLPPNIKKHLDLNSGNDRGRIYRIVPESFQRKPWSKLGQLSSAQLVTILEHPNGWHRDTASRLIYERGDQTIIPALRKLARQSKRGVGRLHALSALAGLNALQIGDLAQALQDPHPAVRENAVRSSESLMGESQVPEPLWQALQERVTDDSPRVRYQLAWTLGLAKHPAKWEVLGQLLRSAQDPWLKHAVLANSSTQPLRVWGKLDPSERFGRAGRELLELTGRRAHPDNLREIEIRLRNAGPQELVQALSGLARGIEASGKRVRLESLPMGAEAIQAASTVAQKAEAAVDLRRDAIELLSIEGAKWREVFLAQLSPLVPGQVQLAAISALAGTGNQALLAEVIGRWSVLTPEVRIQSAEILLRRPGATKALLSAVAEGALNRSEIPIHHRERLRNSNDPDIKRLAEQTFGQPSSASVEELLATFAQAIASPGNLARGKAIYDERCASCHRFKGAGFAVGPDFETIQQAGRESALVNLIDPNREVAPRYASYEIETSDGETHTGIIAQETPAAITLRQANGLETEIPRQNLAKIHGGTKSLMPERLEEGLSSTEMADLLAYILP